MAAKKKQVQTEPFEIVPAVPDDLVFARAAEINIQALKAVDYWKDEKRYAMTTDRMNFANDKLKAWQQVKRKCEAIMQSYQLRMF